MIDIVSALDARAVTTITDLRSVDGAFFGIWVSEFASPSAIAGAVAIIGLLLARSRRFHDCLGLAISAGGAVAAAHIIKFMTDRPRPPMDVAAYIEAGSSFPSAHAAAAVGLYGFLAWLLWRDCERQWWHYAAVIGAVIVSALIGASRVFLGVHYPSDVLAGYTVGGLFLTLGILLTRRDKNKNLC